MRKSRRRRGGPFFPLLFRFCVSPSIFAAKGRTRVGEEGPPPLPPLEATVGERWRGGRQRSGRRERTYNTTLNDPLPTLRPSLLPNFPDFSRPPFSASLCQKQGQPYGFGLRGPGGECSWFIVKVSFQRFFVHEKTLGAFFYF